MWIVLPEHAQIYTVVYALKRPMRASTLPLTILTLTSISRGNAPTPAAMIEQWEKPPMTRDDICVLAIKAGFRAYIAHGQAGIYAFGETT